MANSYPAARSLAAKYLNCQLVDVSAASIAYVPVPSQGILVDAYCTIANATTSADSIVTVKVMKNSTSTSVGTITVATSGSAAGSTFQLAIGSTGTESIRSLKAGDAIIFDSDGAGSTTAVANFTAVLLET